jgi:hypothetical protein
VIGSTIGNAVVAAVKAENRRSDEATRRPGAVAANRAANSAAQGSDIVVNEAALTLAGVDVLMRGSFGVPQTTITADLNAVVGQTLAQADPVISATATVGGGAEAGGPSEDPEIVVTGPPRAARNALRRAERFYEGGGIRSEKSPDAPPWHVKIDSLVGVPGASGFFDNVITQHGGTDVFASVV